MPRCTVTACILLAFTITTAQSQPLASTSAGARSGAFIRVRADELRWMPIPGGSGVEMANVYGDPSKPGHYISRARFPPHVMSTPHTHPNDRYITVLEGTWYTGTGPVFDPDTTVPLTRGSVMKHPGGAPHWDGSADDYPVVIQVEGEGPVTNLRLDPYGPYFANAHLRKHH